MIAQPKKLSNRQAVNNPRCEKLAAIKQYKN